MYYKATLMVAAIVFPEIMMCMAIAQWRLAKKVHRKWIDVWKKEPKDENNGTEWLGMAGAYFVVMGGYIVQPQAADNQGRKKAVESQDRVSHTQSSNSDKKEGEEVTTITAEGFMKLLDNDVISRLKDGRLNKSHFDRVIIEDKGKSSTLAKVLVVFQVLWIIIQIGGRKHAGLPVTLLEASIAVQIPYSIISFFFWWDKPLDVGEPTALPLEKDSLPNSNKEDHSPEAFTITENIKNNGFLHMTLRASYDVVYYFCRKFEIASAVTAIINGGLHAAMWNAYFPTPIERLLWRLSCVGMGLFPVIYYFLVRGQDFEDDIQKATFDIRRESGGVQKQVSTIFKSVWEFCQKFVLREPRTWYSVCGRIVHVILLGLCVDAYVMCILYMTVESFVSLRELPAGAYSLVRWSSVIPHF